MTGDVFAEGDRVFMPDNGRTYGRQGPTRQRPPRRGTILARHGRAYWVVADNTPPVIVGHPDSVLPETWFDHMLTRITEESRETA